MLPLRVALGVIAITVLASCAEAAPPAAPPSAPPSLTGTSWILTEVALDGALVAALDSSGSLTFADDTFSGSTGCNRFNGTWSADGEALVLTPGGMTLMGCPGDLGAQESAVVSALNATASYLVAADALTLLDSSGSALANYTASVSDLTMTSWRATGVNNGAGAVVTTDATPNQTLQFGENAEVSGFGGCSSFTGTYTAADGAISISALSPDPCESAAQDEYLVALQAATVFSIDGDRLELRDGTAALQAGFVAN